MSCYVCRLLRFLNQIQTLYNFPFWSYKLTCDRQTDRRGLLVVELQHEDF